ncbi:DUF2190 family protein [Ralstonia pseudosolanacearum]|uniref:DUF2190 family protein n=1 Tax=Ralstonia solanacearum TaxID=305 RepID=A0AA92QBD4_RALSL|nr:DUF2190 family protein [Ralstonia pseudosolanacearum]QOK96809.1 DUF2190 family protein [Ralstonia pseudosolanacearum]
MKTQQICLTVSVLAATALTRLRFVGLAGGVCAGGAKALGTAETNADAGEQAPVNTHGVLLVEAGAVIAAGTEVESDANGCAIAKNAGISNGFALDAAAAAGDVIRIVRGI